MINKVQIRPRELSFRIFRISSATLGAVSLAILLFALVRPAATSAGADTQSPILLAINEGEATLGIVDPRAGKQLATIAEGAVTGHEVVASFDGKLAYVPIYGDSSVGDPGTDGRELVVIDIASRKVVERFDFGHGVRPHCALMNPHDGLLYVTTELDRTVTIIDPKTLKLVGTIPTGQDESHMLVFSHDGRFGYTANVKPGTVSVLDLKARKLLSVIPVSPATQRISISVDDRMVFTADQTKPRVAVIDTATNKLKTWISLSAVGYGTATTRDGRWLLVAIQSTSQVAVVDLQTLQVARTIDVPPAPHEILIAPGNDVAYVSCTKSGKIAAISLSNWSIKNVIEAGNRVDGLAWAASQ
ncbi:MAG: cytochrome D1 domain-containing protein [Candidatus Acidiferrales bacterium]